MKKGGLFETERAENASLEELQFKFSTSIKNSKSIWEKQILKKMHHLFLNICITSFSYVISEKNHIIKILDAEECKKI